jgi:uncharacterized protein (TIGR03435 family)
MKLNENNLGRTLENSFPSASTEQVESARGKIYERLLSNWTGNPSAESISVTRAPRWRWSYPIAATTTLLVAATAWIFVSYRPVDATLQSPDGSVYRSVDGKLIPLRAGERIEFGDVLRSSDRVDSAILLADGSRVEMRKESELSLEEAADGIRIRLDRGGVIVQAAKQQTGRHLYVRTRDVRVSVVGTVFFVNAEAEGSRVGVYEGEVHVQQGATETKLGPGESVATNPAMPALPLKEAIEWSREAPMHLASLQPREAFEAASIRPNGEGIPGGASPNIRACDGGSAVELSPNRFAIFRRNIYMLITMAYFNRGNLVQGCLYANRLGLLTGGPAWLQSDVYDIQAVIPSDSFSSPPTIRDPKLQRMVQSLLEDRFKLVLSRQMQEMPVYLMTLKEPSKFADAKDASVWLTKPMTEQGATAAQLWSAVKDRQGLSSYENGDTNARIYGVNATMSELATTLGRLMGRPILDRTDLTARASFYVETFSEVGELATPPLEIRSPAEIRSIISELEKQAGIKLELSKERIEVLKVDHIERPSEN